MYTIIELLGERWIHSAVSLPLRPLSLTEEIHILVSDPLHDS